jgi:hypothetical protein
MPTHDHAKHAKPGYDNVNRTDSQTGGVGGDNIGHPKKAFGAFAPMHNSAPVRGMTTRHHKAIHTDCGSVILWNGYAETLTCEGCQGVATQASLAPLEGLAD